MVRFDTSIWGGQRSAPDPRHSPQTAALDPPFVCACLAMFDAGLNTAEIAGRLFEREAAVATAVRLGREARRFT
jgi:hypothetical protein